MEYEFVKVEKRNHISIVTINRPEVYNAVHPPLSLELDQVWNDFIEDRDPVSYTHLTLPTKA